MQIKRLLDDREVFVEDRVFDAQGRPTRFRPEALGCYVINVNRFALQLLSALSHDLLLQLNRRHIFTRKAF